MNALDLEPILPCLERLMLNITGRMAELILSKYFWELDHKLVCKQCAPNQIPESEEFLRELHAKALAGTARMGGTNLATVAEKLKQELQQPPLIVPEWTHRLTPEVIKGLPESKLTSWSSECDAYLAQHRENYGESSGGEISFKEISFKEAEIEQGRSAVSRVKKDIGEEKLHRLCFDPDSGSSPEPALIPPASPTPPPATAVEPRTAAGKTEEPAEAKPAGVSDAAAKPGASEGIRSSPDNSTISQRNPSNNLTGHEGKIWGVIQRNPDLEGLLYARELDRAEARPRKAWLEDDCPGTYEGAYKLGDPWRKRIQDEKYRIKKKAEALATRRSLVDE